MILKRDYILFVGTTVFASVKFRNWTIIRDFIRDILSTVSLYNERFLISTFPSRGICSPT